MKPYCLRCYEPLATTGLETCPRCRRVKPDPAGWPLDPLLGQEIDSGKYRVLRIIGEGGFGCVYKVEHTMLEDCAFALKAFGRATRATESEHLQEVQLLMGFDHPNIVKCHDVGRLPSGAIFIRMELVKGLELNKVLASEGGTFEPWRAARVGLQIASALRAAHARKVLHRDLKPENIFMLEGDEVRVIDFGIAKITGEDGQGRQLSRVIGTPTYMAPEQFQAGLEVDGRLDVYQLGAVMHTMLTGGPPFAPSGHYNIHQLMLHVIGRQAAHPKGPGPRPSLAKPLLARDAPWLDELVSRMLSITPSDRPDTKEVHGLLQAQLDEAPSVSPPSVAQPLATETTAAFEDTLLPARRHLSSPLHIIQSDAQPATWRSSLTPETSESIEKARPARALDPTIIILPFETRGSGEDDYLAEGLTEDITDALSTTAMKVRPKGQVDKLPEGLSAQEAGQALDVAFVAQGSLTHVGDKLVIQTRVIDVEEGFQFWAKRFRCSVEDLFDISDEIVENITEAIVGESLAKTNKEVMDPAVVDLYLRGRHELRRNWHGDVSEAVVLLDRAASLSPSDPLVLSMLAVSRARCALNGSTRERQQVSLASEAATRAVLVAPHRCEPYYARAIVHFIDSNIGAARDALSRSLERLNDYADAHDLLGRILLETGPLPLAVEHLQKALRLEPGLISARFDLARACAFLGEWSELDRLLDFPQKQGPDHALSRIVRARYGLWGAPEIDTETLLDGIDTDSYFSAALLIFVEVQQTGRFSPEGKAWWSNAANSAATTRRKSLNHQCLAEMHFFLGESDEGFENIELAIDAGLSDLVWMDNLVLFEQHRNTPRFEALRDKVVQTISRSRR